MFTFWSTCSLADADFHLNPQVFSAGGYLCTASSSCEAEATVYNVAADRNEGSSEKKGVWTFRIFSCFHCMIYALCLSVCNA